MQTETTATDTTSTAAQVDTTAATATATAAPASAAPAEGTATTDTSTTTAPAGEEGSTQQEQERNDKGQYKSGVQKRIDDLTYRRNAAEREAAHWKSVAESRQAPAAPKLADFDSHDAYDAALLDHKIETRVSDGLAKTAEQQSQKFSKDAQEAAGEAYNQRVTEAVVRIPDFVEVVSKANIAISPALQEALRDSDKGPDLVYHLAKNPAEAERLNSMSVRQMDREIGRLETTIGAKSAPPPPPAARTTNAPPPVKPGSPASAPGSNDPNKMNQTEFEVWAKANGSKYIR